MTVHKNAAPSAPHLSIILLDWSCRERFSALDWLLKQDVPKDQYELIWVEAYDRVVEEVMEKADVVITCSQQGLYHKHVGYNVGLLQAKGTLVCVCDSDAVFPPDFVSSVLRSFRIESEKSAVPMVLMHYEWRTALLYPDGLTDSGLLKDAARWQWWPLIVNEGACMTVRRVDAIRFGGFDEHASFRGYLCGPYDLGWRLINAGWPEVWHDESTALWHFSHPDPIGANGQRATLKQLREKAYPHIHGHAFTAVEAFSVGRFQPLQENPKIWALRMQERRIGSELEFRYANLTGQDGYSPWTVRLLWLSLFCEVVGTYLKSRLWDPFLKLLPSLIGARAHRILRAIYWNFVAVYKINHIGSAKTPILLCFYRGYNIVKFKDSFYAAPDGTGDLDFTIDEKRSHPGLLVSGNYGELLDQVKAVSRGYLRARLLNLILLSLASLIGASAYGKLRSGYWSSIGAYRISRVGSAKTPTLLCSYRGYNIVKFKEDFYSTPDGMENLDLETGLSCLPPDVFVSANYHALLKMVRDASKQ